MTPASSSAGAGGRGEPGRHGRHATHGLTLGKFAPFHRGHQLVVETALAECERVSVVVYDAPSTTTVPLGVRAAWIRDLYPQVRAVEGWAGPEDVGSDPRIRTTASSLGP